MRKLNLITKGLIYLLSVLFLAVATSCGERELTNDELIGQILSTDHEERLKATIALGTRGPRAAVSEKYLIDALLKDQSAAVRQHAARAVGWVVPQSPVGLEALINTLSDPIWFVRRAAAEALGDIGPPAQKAVPALVATMGEYWFAEQAISGAKSAIRPEAQEQFQVTSDDFLKNIRLLHLTIVDSLGKIGSHAAESVPALVRVISSSDVEAQTKGANALGQIGVKALSARRELENLLLSPEIAVRKAATEALGKISARESVPALAKLIDDRSAEVRRAAATALRTINTPAALDPLNKKVKGLIPQLQNKDWNIRRDVATALEELGTKEAQEALKNHRRFFPDA